MRLSFESEEIMTKSIWNKRITFIAIGWLMILAVVSCDVGIAVPRYEIVTGKASEPVRIVLLTDFHSSSYGENQQVLVSAVNAQNPDIVLLCGDIAEEVRSHRHTEELLPQLSEKYPCFYVTGNHEERSGESDNIKEIVRSCGVTVLEGDFTDINGIRICGVDNSPSAGQLDNCINSTGNDVFTVFMSHRPDRVDLYSGNGFDLVVSGHAHGGQIIIPGILNGVYAPNQGFFPEYAGGSYILSDGCTEMIVSRGLCKNILPRVFNKPEVVVIDIVPENE